MEFNWIAHLLSALIPLVIGAIWYSPRVFGNTWMKVSGVTEAQIRNSNMLVIFGLTFVLGLLASFTVKYLVVHQAHLYSALMNDPGFGQEGSAAMVYLNDFMDKYGNEFRTFKHGAFHGLFSGLTFVLPIIAIIGLFERRGWAYIGIHAGYWIVTLTLMGGLICGWPA